MQPEDKYFEQLTQDELWKHYCGFLDFSVDEFMAVQQQLLLDQIDRVWSSPLGRKVMGDRKPVSDEGLPGTGSADHVRRL